MNEQQKAFARVLDLIDDAGCLPHVVLVGSWAEYVYREAGLLQGFDPHIRTMDMDFLVRNLRRPTPAVSLVTLARDRGFLVESDVLNGTTKLFDVSGLEVEFLIGKMGAGLEPALKTNVGVTAQAPRHMEILLGNVTEALYLGHQVRVPTPEAYAVHKMVINEQRGAKAEKDRQAILEIWSHLDGARAESLIEKLTKKERASVARFMVAENLSM